MVQDVMNLFLDVLVAHSSSIGDFKKHRKPNQQRAGPVSLTEARAPMLTIWQIRTISSATSFSDMALAKLSSSG